MYIYGLESVKLSHKLPLNLKDQFLLFYRMAIPDKNWQPPFVSLETSMGEIVIELYWNHAPMTCRNFAELARRGYYNGTKFHRIIQDFMIQGGDPTATGKGGSSIYGKTFDDEIHSDLKHTGAGILSMANSGKNTNGSQFFVCTAKTRWLDGKHVVFGQVVEGMDVVKKIESFGSQSGKTSKKIMIADCGQC